MTTANKPLADPDAEYDRLCESDPIDLAKEILRLRAENGEMLTELGGRDEAARERWADKMLAETKLLHMDFRNGATMTLDLAKDLAAAMVAAAKPLLGDGPNYSETVAIGPVGLDGERERYTFVVQRVGKLTPHEARQRAEAGVAAALAFADEMASYCSPHGVAADYAKRLRDRVETAMKETDRG